MKEERFLELALGMQNKLYHVAKVILWSEQDTADVMQDAMLKGWRMRFTLRDESRFEAWMSRLLVNCCRDLQRKRMRDRSLLEEMANQERTQPQTEPGGALELLHSLPEALRLPALLYYCEGYSQKDIGRILGMTSEQVKARVRQARGKMRMLLEEDECDE